MLALWQQVADTVSVPWVTIGLLVLGCVLLFHDLLTPLTWGITGTVGVICIGLVLAAHAVSWIGVLLLLGGVALLLVETHLLPGRGMAAIFGLMLIFSGMFVAAGGTRQAGFSLGVATAVTFATLVAFFAYLPKSPVWKQLGRELQTRSQAVFVPYTDLVGLQGTAISPLRPVGVAVIARRQVTVVTEGEFLEAGTTIKVREVDGERVVVDPVSVSGAVEAV